ncbi:MULTISPECIES: ATP-binding cassette domain-containing protein [unclassified Exiguobacterium]|uniref:ATP-binding cassette domain-containing protein n=1 Tax=unclassified Exiguobacterium TaxID=2644629 RepID=UPI001BEBB01F|nr:MULTISPECIES: ATP-binding cassette domain-containing protein [unclassified Exiguobacterium]
MNESVIQDIVIDVQASVILRMIGLNGAVKTTTIACLMGTIPWMKGTIEMKRHPFFQSIQERGSL